MAQKKKRRENSLLATDHQNRFVPQKMMESLKQTMKEAPNQEAAKLVLRAAEKYQHLTDGTEIKATAARFGTVEKIGYLIARTIFESYERVNGMEQFQELMNSPEARSRYVAYNFGVLARNNKTSDGSFALVSMLNEAGGFNYEKELLKEREWLVPITGALLPDMQTNMIAHWAKTLTPEKATEFVHRVHLNIFDKFVAAVMGGFQDWPLFPIDVIADENGRFLEKYDTSRNREMPAEEQGYDVLDELRANTPTELLTDTRPGQSLLLKMMTFDEATWLNCSRKNFVYEPQVGLYDSRMVPPHKAENKLDFFGLPAMFDFFPLDDDHYKTFVYGPEIEDVENTEYAIVDELLKSGHGKIIFPDGRKRTLEEIENSEEDSIEFKKMLNEFLSIHYSCEEGWDDDNEIADPEEIDGQMRPSIEMLRAAANSERELYAKEIARAKRERTQAERIKELRTQLARAKTKEKKDRKAASSAQSAAKDPPKSSAQPAAKEPPKSSAPPPVQPVAGNRSDRDKQKIESQKVRISNLEEQLRDEREKAEALVKRLSAAEDENRALQKQLASVGEEEAVAEDLDKSILDGKRIVVFGGHRVWCSAMEKFHNSIAVFPGDVLQATFDTRVLQKADAVWFQTNNIGHPTYYRVMHAVKAAGLPYFFFKYAGHGACENQLIKEMEAFFGG